MPDDKKRKANTRSYLNTYIRRGKLVKGPCVVCGNIENVQAHHKDYSKPLEVVWLCVPHHVATHGLGGVEEEEQAERKRRREAEERMAELFKPDTRTPEEIERGRAKLAEMRDNLKKKLSFPKD